MNDLVKGLPDAAAELRKRPDSLRPATIEVIYHHALEVSRKSPAKAAAIAEIAVDFAASIPAFWSDEVRAFLLAKTLRLCGGCYRADEKFLKAEAAFIASYHHAQVAGDKTTLELTALCRQFARLRADQRRFTEARNLAKFAIDLSTSLTEKELGISLVIQGTIDFFVEPSLAIAPLEQARKILDAENDSDFWYRTATQVLTSAISEAGLRVPVKYILSLIQELEELSPETGLFRAQASWAQGLAFRRIGEEEFSLHLFSAGSDFFLEVGLAAHYAAIQVDAALSLLTLGRFEEIRPITVNIVGVLLAFDLKHEALVAASLSSEAASYSGFQSLRNQLLGLNRTPSLGFHPAGVKTTPTVIG